MEVSCQQMQKSFKVFIIRFSLVCHGPRDNLPWYELDVACRPNFVRNCFRPKTYTFIFREARHPLCL